LSWVGLGVRKEAARGEAHKTKAMRWQRRFVEMLTVAD